MMTNSGMIVADVDIRREFPRWIVADSNQFCIKLNEE